MAEQTDRDGRRIGNYRLVRLLGRGGFAEVHLAKHIHLNTRAAVKLLNTQLANEGIAGFRNEARMIAGLAHPHIVRVLDFGIDNDVPYLVMDYAPNGTLRQRHSRGFPLSLQLVVSYVQQVAGALQYAHEQRLIHRDIKPENMLLGHNNEILLSDFGIALIAQSSHFQKTQDVAGTLVYMAPEQIEAHPRPASDQYSLGIVVYEWLTGQLPFQGTMTEIVIKHATATPPSLRLFVPELPPAVEQVVLRALQKDPHARFPSVLAFAQALEQASGGLAQPFAGGSAPASPDELSTYPLPNSPFPQRQPSAPYESAQPSGDISTQLMPQTSGQYHISPAYTPTPQTPASLPQTGSPLPPQLAYPPYSPGQLSSSSQTGQPLSSPKGQGRNMSRRAIIAALAGGAVVTVGGTAYYAYTNARKGISGLLSVPASTPLMTFTDHTSYVWGVAWSPNGKYIASASADGTSHVWDVSTKQLMFSFRSDFRSDYQPTQNLPNDAAYSVAWLPDATGFAVGFADEYAEIFNLTTHQRAGYYDSKNDDNPNRIGILYAVSISPDGRSLALANFFNNDIQIFNVMQQSMTLDLPGHEDAVRSLAWSHNGQYLASGSDDMTVKIWNTSTGEMLFTYKKHTNAIRAVSWSPDDTRIVSNSENGPMYIWTWNSGQTLHTFENDEVAAAWSHNGKYIACSGSSGSDGKIQTHVRDAQSGSLLHAFPTGPITSVSWSPDDSRIVTANLVTVSGSTINKNIVQVWQI